MLSKLILPIQDSCYDTQHKVALQYYKYEAWSFSKNKSDACPHFSISDELLKMQPLLNTDYQCTASVIGDMKHSDWIKVMMHLQFAVKSDVGNIKMDFNNRKYFNHIYFSDSLQFSFNILLDL